MRKVKYSRIKKEYNIFKSNQSPFNSKLFFNLDTTSNTSDINETELNNSFDSLKLETENNKYYFLLSDLIKELDSFQDDLPKKENTEKKVYLINNTNNYLINSNIYYPVYNPFIKNNISNSIYNNGNKKINQNKNFNNKKGDWVCPLCKNLNFSFRTICNRCKVSKKEVIAKEK